MIASTDEPKRPSPQDIDRAVIDTLESIDANIAAVAFQAQKLLEHDGFVLRGEDRSILRRTVEVRWNQQNLRH